MKIALIIYAIVAFVYFVLETYFSYKDKYRIERTTYGAKIDIRWLRIIFAAIFWPIDILITIIKKIAYRNSK